MASKSKVTKEPDPPRSNLAIEDIKNLILRKTDGLFTVMDNGLLERVKLDQKYEDMMPHVEEQVARMFEGFKAIDRCDNKERFAKIKAKLLGILREDFNDALYDLAEAYIDAVFTANKKHLE